MAAKVLCYTTMFALMAQLATCNPYIVSYTVSGCNDGNQLHNYAETVAQNQCIETPKVPQSIKTTTFNPFPECFIYLYDEPGCSNNANVNPIGMNHQGQQTCTNAKKGTKSFKWACPPVEVPPTTAS